MRSDSNNRGRMRYGYKNRALVFSRPARTSVSYRSPGDENGGMMEVQQSSDPFGPGVDVVFASTFPGTATGEITARLQPQERRTQPATFPLTVGAGATVEGFPVRVASVGRLDANDRSVPRFYSGPDRPDAPTGPRWKVSFSIERSDEIASSGAEFLGADGAPIENADATGRPKPRSRPDPRMGYDGAYPGYGGFGVAQPVGGGPNRVEYVLTVDPKYVKRVRFNATRAEIAVFRDIPLDPKG